MITALQSLQNSRSAITPALRAAIERLDDRSRHQAAYHFGWITETGSPTDADPGKAVRPALAFLSAEAVGASHEVALPGAVAVELLHNFSLVHDDLMDRDEERRHRQTVWKLWGSSSAILTGDALLALSHEVLLETGSPYAAPAARLLASTTRHLIRGQVQDISFEERAHVTVDECIDMAAGKTAALLSASAAIGAVLAGSTPHTVDALAMYGRHIGLAFQLVDDVLGIWGDPSITGKSIHSDLRSRKKSLPVTYVLNEKTTQSVELSVWLSRAEQADDFELHRVADIIEQGGGRDWALREATRLMTQAEVALDNVEIDVAAKAQLLTLGRFVVNRDI